MSEAKKPWSSGAPAASFTATAGEDSDAASSGAEDLLPFPWLTSSGFSVTGHTQERNSGPLKSTVTTDLTRETRPRVKPMGTTRRTPSTAGKNARKKKASKSQTPQRTEKELIEHQKFLEWYENEYSSSGESTEGDVSKTKPPPKFDTDEIVFHFKSMATLRSFGSGMYVTMAPGSFLKLAAAKESDYKKKGHGYRSSAKKAAHLQEAIVRHPNIMPGAPGNLLPDYDPEYDHVPYLQFTEEGDIFQPNMHEGRHRAYASSRASHSSFPVFICCEGVDTSKFETRLKGGCIIKKEGADNPHYNVRLVK